MKKSRVTFSNLRTTPSKNLLDKFEAIIRKGGIETLDLQGKLTAIKMHFGEPGNLAFIRPNYAARLASIIRDLGGIPFLTDTCTLYSGRRSNAPNHLAAAQENGFTPATTGCQVVIADGLKGTNSIDVEINGKHCRTAKIAGDIVQADALISLTHFKGHEMTGFGGTLKNLGMGCASVGGKLEMHSTSQPNIVTENCTGCHQCVTACAHDAIALNAQRIAVIDGKKCVGCGQCIAVCQFNAAQVVWEAASEATGEKMAEYAAASLKGKPAFHISLLVDISPDCDCWSHNDYPLVANIGMAASLDPVALEQACVDMVTAAPALPGSRIMDENNPKDHLKGQDKFTLTHPDTHWESTLIHAEKLGMGTRIYERVAH